MWGSKRSVLEIFANILNALADDPLKKTHITYKANLDSRAASKYMAVLLKLELVARSGEDQTYFVITQKGRDFITHYEGLTKIIGVVG